LLKKIKGVRKSLAFRREREDSGPLISPPPLLGWKEEALSSDHLIDLAEQSAPFRVKPIPAKIKRPK